MRDEIITFQESLAKLQENDTMDVEVCFNDRTALFAYGCVFLGF